MRNFQTLLLFIGLSCQMIDLADCQLVQINGNGFGGVNIRAPFVRINTNPYGPTHVRAPFVNLNAPPAYYQPQPFYVQPNYNGGRPPVYGTPVYAAPDASSNIVVVPGMPDSSDNAPSYQAGSSAIESSAVPTPARQPNNLVDRELPKNTLPDPSGMKSVLEQPTGSGSELQVLRQDLIASSNALHQSLARYSNAPVWQDFLALPGFVRENSEWRDGSTIDQAQMNHLLKTLSRFEKTNGKAEMHLINNLEEFRRTHQELSNFVQHLQNQIQQDTVDLPAPPDQNGDK